MIDWLLAASLFATGVVHVIPAFGVISATRLCSLYGLTLDDPCLILLLRHRAMMFAILGGFFIAAAFVPAWRTGASLVALLAMLGFVVLAGSAPLALAIRRVVRVDAMLSIVLIATLTLRSVVAAP